MVNKREKIENHILLLGGSQLSNFDIMFDMNEMMFPFSCLYSCTCAIHGGDKGRGKERSPIKGEMKLLLKLQP